MPTVFPTLEQHEDLLREKGYLEQHLKTATQVGYWLLEFKEQFNHCADEAQLEQAPGKFIMELSGKFNGYLDPVHFNFRYKYDPADGLLTLVSLHARLDRTRKTYYFSPTDELPAALEVHELLSRPAVLQNNKALYERLAYEFRRDRNPDNDYMELGKGEKRKTHPLDLIDYPPNQLRFRKKR